MYRSYVLCSVMMLNDHVRHLMPMGVMSNLIIKHGKIVIENILMAFVQCLMPNMFELLLIFVALDNWVEI